MAQKRTRRQEAIATDKKAPTKAVAPSKAAGRKSNGIKPAKSPAASKQRTPKQPKAAANDQWTVRSILRAKIVGADPATGQPRYDYMVDWEDVIDQAGKVNKYEPTYEDADNVSPDLISEFWLSMKGSAIHRTPKELYDDYDDEEDEQDGYSGKAGGELADEK